MHKMHLPRFIKIINLEIQLFLRLVVCANALKQSQTFHYNNTVNYLDLAITCTF